MRLGIAVAALLVTLTGCGADKTPVAHVAGTALTRGDYKKLLDDTPACKDDTPNCRFQHLRAVQSAMGTVIHYEWARLEGKRQGIQVTDRDRKNIELSGDDKLPGWFRDAIALDTKLKAQISASPTDEEVRAYTRHILGIRARRLDAEVVATRSEADIRQALRYVEDGVPIATVAERYAADWRSLLGPKVPVGHLEEVTLDPQRDPGGRKVDPALRRMLSKGRFNNLAGPLRVGDGWYVFYLRGEHRPPSAAERNGLIKAAKESLTDDMKSARLESLLEKHWLRKTVCEKRYVVASRSLLIGGFGSNYYSTAGCGNYVPFKTPAPG